MSETPGSDTSARLETPDHEPERLADRETDVEEALRRRTPLRVRALQSLGLLILLGVVTGLIGRPLLATLNHVRDLVPTATPVPLGPMLVLSNVSFGTVTINGASLAGSPPHVTQFRRGLNTITLAAPPFRPLTCQVQWPSGHMQEQNGQGPPECDLRLDVTVPRHVGGRTVAPVAVLELWLSGDDLPADARANMLASVSAALHAVPLSSTVPAGEYIATGLDAQSRITSQRVAAPQRADLVVTPTALDATGDTFCEDPGCAPEPTVPTSRWAVGAGVSVQWQFTAPTGGQGQVARSAVYPPASFLRLVLKRDSMAQWTLDLQGTEELNGFGLPFALPAMICPAGADYLWTLGRPDQFNVAIVANHALAGCELHLADASGASKGLFVWRFGVLLAADEQAHALFPDLPIAPPSALAAAGA